MNTLYFKIISSNFAWLIICLFTIVFQNHKRIQELLAASFNRSDETQSSVDEFSQILLSIKKFWEDQSPAKSPNPTMIVSDMCRFSIVYFEKLNDQAGNCDGMNHTGVFQMPLEVSSAINIISSITEELQAQVVKVAVKKTECNLRVMNIIKNALQFGKSVKSKLIQASVNKMLPSIKALLLEGAECTQSGVGIGERFITYIEGSLLSLDKSLENVDLKAFKEQLLKVILEVFSVEFLESSKPQTFYVKLNTIFKSTIEIFQDGTIENAIENDISCDLSERIIKLESFLNRHGLNTANLIHQYYKDRHQMQQRMDESPFTPFGTLIIKCSLQKTTLKILIVKATDLRLDVSKPCDSYVKISFSPDYMYDKLQSLKTNVVRNNNDPEYSQLFEV